MKEPLTEVWLMPDLERFVRESNRIEGIFRDPTSAEIKAHEDFLQTSVMCLEEKTLCDFVAVVAPGKLLREKRGMNVRVGSHIAPPGGPEISDALIDILVEAAEGFGDPYDIHCRYKMLHPFMDGNGRSGRALWLWLMKQHNQLNAALSLGFLHHWYYQTLAHYG